jgi:small subunit ribosomal protein S18
MSERAKIRARRVTGNSAQQQREVAKAIRVAREMALLPYSVRQVTQRKGGRRDRDDRGDRGDRGERGDRGLRLESSAPRPDSAPPRPDAGVSDAGVDASPALVEIDAAGGEGEQS